MGVDSFSGSFGRASLLRSWPKSKSISGPAGIAAAAGPAIPAGSAGGGAFAVPVGTTGPAVVDGPDACSGACEAAAGVKSQRSSAKAAKSLSVRRSTSNARGGTADSATTAHGCQLHAVASCALQKEMLQVLGQIGTSDNENNHAVYVHSECHFGRHDLKSPLVHCPSKVTKGAAYQHFYAFVCESISV